MGSKRHHTHPFVLALLVVGCAALAVAQLAGAGPRHPDSLDSDLDEPVRSDWADDNENINDHDDPEPEPPPEPDPEEETPPPPEIFGEPIPGQRILFVIDRSCSMGWAPTYRWNRLKQELLPALDALHALNGALKAQWQQGGQQGPEPKVEFEIIRYNSGANRWRGQIREADEFNVNHAKNWVNHTNPSGGTNWGTPLRYAYNVSRYPDIDTLYFMSDGYPNRGPNWRRISQIGRSRQKEEFHFIGQQIGGTALQSTYIRLVSLNQPNASSSFVPD